MKEWVDHYNEYKKAPDYYVIADNGAKEEYVHELEDSFKDAILIKRNTNDDCTVAYNVGIRYILEKQMRMPLLSLEMI